MVVTVLCSSGLAVLDTMGITVVSLSVLRLLVLSVDGILGELDTMVIMEDLETSVFSVNGLLEVSIIIPVTTVLGDSEEFPFLSVETPLHGATFNTTANRATPKT